jgi:hypothetical protein
MPLTGVQLKQFINRYLGIPKNKLRVEASPRQGYHSVRIIPEPYVKSVHEPLRYAHTFPEEFGNRCMGVVYGNSKELSAQNWGGNITSTGIAMHPREWDVLVKLCEPPAHCHQCEEFNADRRSDPTIPNPGHRCHECGNPLGRGPFVPEPQRHEPVVSEAEYANEIAVEAANA